MRQLIEDILKGYHRNIRKTVINVDIQKRNEDKNSMVEEGPMLVIDGETKKSVDEFFNELSHSFIDTNVDFVYSNDKTFKIRRSSYDMYAETLYVFSREELANRRVQTAFDKFVTRARQQYPYAEQTEKEITYAQALAAVAYDERKVSFNEIEDIPGYREFYNKNKSIVEKRLHRMLKDKKSFIVSDLMIRILVLGIINALFFLNLPFVALLVVDILCAGAIACLDEIIVKEGIKAEIARDVDKEIKGESENLLWLGLNAAGTKDELEPVHTNNNAGELVNIRNKVLKAIRADIRIIDQIRYPGYQEDLKPLYELAGMFIKAIADEKSSSRELDDIKEVLVRLIDIERALTTRINYFGTLNAEVLLHDVEPSYEVKGLKDTDTQEVMFDMEDRSKKLEF